VQLCAAAVGTAAKVMGGRTAGSPPAMCGRMKVSAAPWQCALHRGCLPQLHRRPVQASSCRERALSCSTLGPKIFCRVLPSRATRQSPVCQPRACVARRKAPKGFQSPLVIGSGCVQHRAARPYAAHARARAGPARSLHVSRAPARCRDPHMLLARTAHAAVAHPTLPGALLLFGGFGGPDGAYLNDVVLLHLDRRAISPPTLSCALCESGLGEGQSVIIVGPTLHLHQCGTPEISRT